MYPHFTDNEGTYYHFTHNEGTVKWSYTYPHMSNVSKLLMLNIQSEQFSKDIYVICMFQALSHEKETWSNYVKQPIKKILNNIFVLITL